MKYEYRCRTCKKKFQSGALYGLVRNDVRCPKCGSDDVVKLISKPHLIFKGTGWGKDKK